MEKSIVIVPHGHKHLYGVLFLPDRPWMGGKTGQEKDYRHDSYPLVIGCHGFDGSYSHKLDYARYLAERGIAFYTFDFYGGSRTTMSGGTMEEMSVLTEADDLEAVLRFFRADSRFDPDRILLWGHSQGGYVASYLAGTRPDWVRVLILLYPAYVIQDDAEDYLKAHGSFPDHYYQWDCTLGKIYGEDALSQDIYQVISRFPGKVLIVHGDQDQIVPISYSRKALKYFPKARLHVMEGAGHGFEGKDREIMKEEALAFLEEVLS